MRQHRPHCKNIEKKKLMNKIIRNAKLCAECGRHLLLPCLTLLMFILSSCSGQQSGRTIDGGDTLRMEYSELLTIVRCDSYTTVDIANPWHKGSVLHRYVLVDKTSDADAKTLPEGTVVRIPLERSVTFSSVHAALLRELGREDAIAGMADVVYLTDGRMIERVRNGRVRDVGMSANPDIESLIDLSPDALLVSPFENSGGYGKLEQMGMPLIECADYMETSPLGRAEWMRFYGLLYGAETTADSLFAAVDSSYNALSALAASSKERPTIVMDKMTGTTWYMPGGRSTIGRMLTDAATTYTFASDSSSGSLALNFETVLDRCGNSDIWLFRHSSATPMTYYTLLSAHHRYDQLRPFREHRCYGCNVSRNGFFEETSFRPDLLLRDIITIAHPDIAIAHPEIIREDSLRYFNKLQ